MKNSIAASTHPTVKHLARDLEMRIQQSKNSGARTIIGIVGAPGTGKSTLADTVASLLDPSFCVVVPMDGFHLGQKVLDETGAAVRKGAPDTYDIGGYLSLLRRLRSNDEPTVYAPVFRRSIEEPIAASIAVPAATPVILTEGNYLLTQRDGWAAVRSLLDEVWFVDVPEDIRVRRLLERHIAFGKEPEAARRWVSGPDAANADIVFETRDLADRILAWT